MKKILTLLIAAAAATATLHAQSKDEGRRVILGDPKDNGVYDRDVARGKRNNDRYPVYPDGNYNNNRQYQIDQLNREYDAKIHSIRDNRYLSNHEKGRIIGQLEKDRENRIKEINRAYSNAGDHYDNKGHNNGKHKGWYKKNKHRNKD